MPNKFQANPQSEVITIKGAIAHLGNGKKIPNSYITFEKGKIIAIGEMNPNITLKGNIINANGKTSLPWDYCSKFNLRIG